MLALLCATAAQAWWGGGHEILTRASVLTLPKEIPAFFRAAAPQLAHLSVDADISKHRRAPHARESEHPEHYCDIELLQGVALPASRFEFIARCCSIGVAPDKVGMLPYALAEWTDRLAVAFAEHRRWPKNATIRNKCLVYAGFLAHYAQDLCQPLHTTIHYDGRAAADGSSPHSGIHEKVDALIEYLHTRPENIAAGVSPAAVDSLMPFILAKLAATHALVDTVYAMEQDFPARKGDEFSPAVAAFAAERMRRAVALTAGLYVYAWRHSESIVFEKWLTR